MKVIIKFTYYFGKEKYNQMINFINDNPIKNKSNGSLVFMKNSNPWLDYKNVNYNELINLLKFIEDSVEELRDNIQLEISRMDE